jgi:hypothetical protein
MSDTCDPRKTGCDCYPFPHRKGSHPHKNCVGWVSQKYLDRLERQLSPDLFRAIYIGEWVAPEDGNGWDVTLA